MMLEDAGHSRDYQPNGGSGQDLDVSFHLAIFPIPTDAMWSYPAFRRLLPITDPVRAERPPCPNSRYVSKWRRNRYGSWSFLTIGKPLPNAEPAPAAIARHSEYNRLS
jgi:hypothetical protein